MILTSGRTYILGITGADPHSGEPIPPGETTLMVPDSAQEALRAAAPLSTRWWRMPQDEDVDLSVSTPGALPGNPGTTVQWAQEEFGGMPSAKQAKEGAKTFGVAALWGFGILAAIYFGGRAYDYAQGKRGVELWGHRY